jgi:hypothetical protein
MTTLHKASEKIFHLLQKTEKGKEKLRKINCPTDKTNQISLGPPLWNLGPPVGPTKPDLLILCGLFTVFYLITFNYLEEVNYLPEVCSCRLVQVRLMF